MKSRPILFSGPMVQALLAGTKTQTRRVVTPQPFHGELVDGHLFDEERLMVCPHGAKGDRLWVRETWCRTEDGGYAFRADDWGPVHPSVDETWRPSIFMPAEACRLCLKITSVRAERVREISQADAIAEGMAGLPEQAQLQYRVLWDQLNAKRGYGWERNPWVWVIEFRKVEP